MQPARSASISKVLPQPIPLLSKERHKTMECVHPARPASTKQLLPQHLAFLVPKDTTPALPHHLSVPHVHEASMQIPLKKPTVTLALLDATTTKPNKPLPPPAKGALLERTHLPPTPPLASIVPQAHISKIGKAPFPNTTNVQIVKIVPLASIPNFTPIPRNVSSVHRLKSLAQLIAVGVVRVHTSTSLPVILTEQQHPRVVYALEGTTRTIVI